ncbi:MAG: hypothetical protein J6386_07540 [Candidatus Synoicihabitans palmerolidicus]|nr:hypothetical protein [Candidatus Synoicihabitans palmerolidicus]
MDQISQDAYRSIIQTRLNEIADEIESLSGDTEAISPDVSIGRLSRLDSMQHQRLALAAKRRHEEERNRLIEELRRIESGALGRCLLCGNDIAVERLDYQPDLVTCVPCTQRRK